jgi:hypothetical protein
MTVKTHTRLIIALPVLMLLASCAADSGLYRWHGYDQKLFSYYQKPETADEFRVEMETAVQEVEKGGGRVAPGICAEIGTLYLQKSDKTSAVMWYKKERDIWPESVSLMDALIATLQKADSPRESQ